MLASEVGREENSWFSDGENSDEVRTLSAAGAKLVYQGDTDSSWFISATYKYKDLKNDEVEIPISRDLISGVSTEVYVEAGPLKQLSSGKPGIVKVYARTFRSIGGYCYGRNAVLVSTTTTSIAKTNEYVVHELGHALHMVPNGLGTGPDRPKNHYTEKGHFGHHCSTGLTDHQRKQDFYQDRNRVGYGTCVMFGGDSYKEASHFCPDCVTAGLKVDLTPGFRS